MALKDWERRDKISAAGIAVALALGIFSGGVNSHWYGLTTPAPAEVRIVDPIQVQQKPVQLPNQAQSQPGQSPVAAQTTPLEVHVRKTGASAWEDLISDAQVPSSIQVLMSFVSLRSETSKNVTLRAELPSPLNFGGGSTFLANDSHPEGIQVVDGIASGGIVIGSYLQNANAFLLFTVYVYDVDSTQCGMTPLVIHTTATVDDPAATYSADVPLIITKDC